MILASLILFYLFLLFGVYVNICGMQMDIIARHGSCILRKGEVIHFCSSSFFATL
jgi:hypothetical protein